MKKILILMASVAMVALVYYLFGRPYEFEVNFSTRTTPGDVIETIRIWSRSLDNAEVTSVDSFNTLEQKIVWNGRTYLYGWRFSVVNDSVTGVKIEISQQGRYFLNKILVPFTNQMIEEDARTIANQFYGILKKHLEITNVKIIGETEVGSKFCVCRSLETDQIEKANGMMMDFPLLTSFINDFGLRTDGPPVVRITQWSHNLGRLNFDFCFPIIRSDTLPVAKGVFYQELPGTKALKAEYNGNYITSDRAWYELVRFAEKNGYRTTALPIEYFHSNPNTGMNEKEWKADVYLPIN